MLASSQPKSRGVQLKTHRFRSCSVMALHTPNAILSSASALRVTASAASTSPAKAKAFPRTGSVVASPPMLRERRAGSSPWAWMRSGLIDVCKQRPASAIERLLIALDLARDDPLAFNSLIGIGCAHFHAGRYAEAAHWFEQAIAEHPSGVWMHYLLCPAHVLSGRKPEARRSLIHLQRSHPHPTTSRVIAGLTFFSESFRDAVASGLETAGLPL